MTTVDEVLDSARARALASRRASIGTQFVQAPEFAFFRRGGHRSAGSWRSPVVEVIAPPDLRATTIDGAGLTIGEVAPLAPVPAVLPTVASLSAQGTTAANAIQYPYDTAPPITAKAGIIAPGTAKTAAAAMALQLWTQPVVKAAGTINASEEQFDDVPGLAAYIDARLVRAANLAVDADVLATIAALPGLTPSYAAAGANAAALLRQAMVILATSGYLPDAIVMHPNAMWGTLVIVGQELQSANLFYQGALTTDPGLYLYGMRLVPSIAVPTPTTAYLGAFRDASQIFWREEFAIEASNSHLDNFTKNMITLRGERRYAFAAYAPAAFSTVTGLTVLA